MTITIPVWLLWFGGGLLAGWVSEFALFLFMYLKWAKNQEEQDDV